MPRTPPTTGGSARPAQRSYPQARYWMLTIPGWAAWEPPTELPDGILCMRGQQEQGEGGYVHWQVYVHFRDKKRLAGVKNFFPNETHCEPTRSEAALGYVWKEDTRIPDTQFVIGQEPIRRASGADWERVIEKAKKGEFDDIPGDIRVRYYGNLRRIAADNDKPAWRRGIRVKVYWGPTGTGKTYRCWQEAGDDAYIKCPLSKFWCGYQGERNVIIDEFRGGINISHVLKWLDEYPCRVEVKCSTSALKCLNVWITSNLHPKDWYPDLDQATIDAILRRMEIIHVTSRE